MKIIRGTGEFLATLGVLGLIAVICLFCGSWNPNPGGDDQQGFIDSNGIFVGRPHARTIAIAAGQVKPDHGVLYSEDLW